MLVLRTFVLSLSAEFTFIRIGKNSTSANSENQISQILKIAPFRKIPVLQYIGRFLEIDLFDL